MSEAGHAQQHALGAAHAELMGVEFDSFDREREEITLRFRATSTAIPTPRPVAASKAG